MTTPQTNQMTAHERAELESLLNYVEETETGECSEEYLDEHGSLEGHVLGRALSLRAFLDRTNGETA